MGVSRFFRERGGNLPPMKIRIKVERKSVGPNWKLQVKKRHRLWGVWGLVW